MAAREEDWKDSITDLAPSEEGEVRKLYDEFSSQYDNVLSTWGYTAPDVIANYLAKTVPLHAQVLDAGCGTGLTGAALANKGFSNITGTDLSPESVKRARSTGHYKKLEVLNLNNPLPFGSGQFHGAVCVGVFSYIPNPEPTLKELLRVLKPGGTLAFTQREDHYKRFSSAQLFAQLQDSERFEFLEQTGAESYLPQNPSFAEEIGVHYFVWRKLI